MNGLTKYNEFILERSKEIQITDISKLGMAKKHAEYLISIEKIINHSGYKKALLDKYNFLCDYFQKLLEWCKENSIDINNIKMQELNGFSNDYYNFHIKYGSKVKYIITDSDKTYVVPLSEFIISENKSAYINSICKMKEELNLYFDKIYMIITKNLKSFSVTKEEDIGNFNQIVNKELVADNITHVKSKTLFDFDLNLK